LIKKQIFPLLVLLFIFTFNTKLQAQQNSIITAKSGDGIHRILQKHQMDTDEYYQEFIRLNKNKLIKGNQLVSGKKYSLPQKKKSNEANYYAIFGEEHGKFTPIDNRLKGAIYYIVAGHGGPDPGAVGKRNGHILTEDEYAYDISLRLAKELIKHGATVYVIVRDTDDGIRDDAYLKNDKHETVWKDKKIPLNLNKKLRQRAQVINQLYRKNRGRYQRLIVTHIDSRSINERVDVFGYYNSKSKSGKLFTQRLISSLKVNYKKYQPNRPFDGISKSRNGLYMLKYTHPVTAYLELGNIQNTKDQIRFIKSSNRQVLAEWLAEGCIIDYKK
jgi:N-acetylmuramoyl-L-alanine amidase